MKKFIFITIMFLSSIVYAGMCDWYSYTNSVTSFILPVKSGKYYAITKTNTFSNGEPKEIGKGFAYTDWEDNKWNKTHWVSCSIADIEYKAERKTHYLESIGSVEYTAESCYLLTLDCTVEERTQFYAADVKYTDLKGYRRDGTLKWTRDEAGSTDIHCYNKSGMTIVKRVNDPQYCK